MFLHRLLCLNNRQKLKYIWVYLFIEGKKIHYTSVTKKIEYLNFSSLPNNS